MSDQVARISTVRPLNDSCAYSSPRPSWNSPMTGVLTTPSLLSMKAWVYWRACGL